MVEFTFKQILLYIITWVIHQEVIRLEPLLASLLIVNLLMIFSLDNKDANQIIMENGERSRQTNAQYTI